MSLPPDEKAPSLMLAVFHIVLPFMVYRPVGEETPPIMRKMEGFDLFLTNFYQSSLEPSDFDVETAELDSLPNKIGPREPWVTSSRVSAGGEPLVRCDAVELIARGSQFSRSETTQDPPIQLVLDALNDWLIRLKVAVGAPSVRLLDPEQAVWSVNYFDDEFKALDDAPDVFNNKGWFGMPFHLTVLTPEAWNGMARRSATVFDASRLLMLDARRLLPEIGPAVVLAFTALETRIMQVGDLLATARGEGYQELWAWASRPEDYRNLPSITQRMDGLLRILSGKSLKDEPALWENFQKLRKARNRFVHEGALGLGKSKLDYAATLALIASAEKILNWLEELIPEEIRPSTSDGGATVGELRLPGNFSRSAEKRVEISFRPQ